MTSKEDKDPRIKASLGVDGMEITPQQQQIYHAHKLLHKRLDKFSGSDEKTFEEFLEEYSDLVQHFQIPRAIAKSLLPLYLTGSAKLKYQSIEGHDQMSWEQPVTALATKLKNQAALSNIRDELHNMTQGKDSVGEFARKVLTKTKYAFQGQGDKVVAQMATDFFITGLNPEIRRAIRRLPETEDFETVVTRAEKEYRILQQERKEDNDTVQTLNAILRNEKMERLERQLEDMRVGNNQPAQQTNGSGRTNYDGQRHVFRICNRTSNPVRFRGSFQNQRWQPMTRPARYLMGNRPFWSRLSPRTSFQQGRQPYWQQPPRGAFRPPRQPPIPQASRFRPGPRVNTISAGTHLLSISMMLLAAVIPVVAPQYQICGRNMYANRFSLPPRVACTTTPATPMIITQTRLYTEQIPIARMNATKCYRDSLAISVSTVFFFTTSRTILGRRRSPIPRKNCEEAIRTGSIDGRELITMAPGIRTTREIEDESMTTAFWGTNTYLRSVVTLEEGEIASFDGQSLISSLANTVNCTLADGYCVTDEDITIWQPLPWTPRCRYVPTGTYDALVTTQYAIIPGLDTRLSSLRTKPSKDA